MPLNLRITTLCPGPRYNEELELVSPRHSEMVCLDGPQEYLASEDTNAHLLLGYQLVDKGWKATNEEGHARDRVLRCVCIGQQSPENQCIEEIKCGRVTNIDARLSRSTLVVIYLV